MSVTFDIDSILDDCGNEQRMIAITTIDFYNEELKTIFMTATEAAILMKELSCELLSSETKHESTYGYTNEETTRELLR